VKKIDFDEVSVGMTIRRSGTKTSYLNVVEKEKDQVWVKIIEYNFANSLGINGKKYRITKDQFNNIGYIQL
jgi:hypothetical protein